MDSLTPVWTYSWHCLGEMNDHESRLWIGHVWQPKTDVFLIGATMGLLCETNNRFELYLAISKNDKLKPEDYYVSLKQDFLFYAQRDQRSPPKGINDLIKTVFLPAGSGFFVEKDEKIYFKCACMNKAFRKVRFDIFATLYYVELMSTASKPVPRILEKPRILYEKG